MGCGSITARSPALLNGRHHQRRGLRPASGDAFRPGSKDDRPRRYLLAGLFRCGQCGARLVSRPRKGGPARYLCASGPGFAGCGKTYIVAPDLEAWITDAVLIRLDSLHSPKCWRRAIRASEAGELADGWPRTPRNWTSSPKRTEAKRSPCRNGSPQGKPIEARIEHERKRLSRMSGHQQALDGFVGHADRLRKDGRAAARSATSDRRRGHGPCRHRGCRARSELVRSRVRVSPWWRR